jgi:hypothetical protein
MNEPRKDKGEFFVLSLCYFGQIFVKVHLPGVPIRKLFLFDLQCDIILYELDFSFRKLDFRLYSDNT